jgi:hypothetical protein
MSSDDLNLFDDGGFSLMKNLLADLVVDEEDAANWLSLDQLEQELKQLEQSNVTANAPPLTAAGMVVNSQAAAALQQQQQIFQAPMGLTQFAPSPVAPEHNAMDAWSLSLQKFTASSLEEDFLQADSARKSSAATTPPPVSLTFADYNVKEPLTLAPPPGIVPDPSQQVISQAAAKLSQQLLVAEEESDLSSDVVAPTSDRSSEVALAQQLSRNLELIHEHEELQKQDLEVEDSKPPPVRMPQPSPMTPHNSMTFANRGNINQGLASPLASSAPTPMPTPVVVKPTNDRIRDDMVGPPFPMPAVTAIPPTTSLPPTMIPVAVPLPATVAWQTPPPAMLRPPPPRRVVFANPHPSAPPIVATALARQYMSARDISFVVHAMLKPILTSETLGTMSTYHLQYWTRHHPVKPPASKRGHGEEETKLDVVSLEIQARHEKTKEWSSERKVLGSTAKTNVLRPRALIAVSTANLNGTADATANESSDMATKKQQRAALWKSRIYCDQAYQCYSAVVESWQSSAASSSSGSTPSSVQPHLLKLTKCLGITVQTVLVETTAPATEGMIDMSPEDVPKQFRNQYSVDATVLELLFKLPKGKLLLARVLEQALLPPAVVQVLLPVAVSILFAATPLNPPDNEVAYAEDRLLIAWTAVVATLPELSGSAILDAVHGLLKQPASSILSSPARMQCTHALLQRGAMVAANDADFSKQWQATETAFLNLLSSV